MCNATNEIMNKVEELISLKNMIEELQNEAELITDEIKNYMGEEETMISGAHKITYKVTMSKRMDTTALKKVLGDALEGYYKMVETRPFKLTL